MSDNKARQVEILTIQGIMSKKDGRAFMDRILEVSGVHDDTFDPDPYVHAANGGQRRQGLWLERELFEAAPVEYLKMIEERINGG